MKRAGTLTSNPVPAESLPAAAAVPLPPPTRKVFKPTRWLLLAGLISSFAGGLLILGLTLQRYYQIAHSVSAPRPEDLAPGVNSAMVIGGPILVFGVATTVAGLVMWFVRRMLG